MSSRNATREDFDYVIQSILNRSINPLSFISKRVSFSDAADGFPDWLNPSSHVIKAVIEKD
jgi:threonine dehydrogenase-like Zn-dependent dehydrogenase